MYTQRDIARVHNEEMIGQEVEVLIEKQSSESDLVWVGRIAQQAPEIDGITYVGSADFVRWARLLRLVSHNPPTTT